MFIPQHAAPHSLFVFSVCLCASAAHCLLKVQWFAISATGHIWPRWVFACRQWILEAAEVSFTPVSLSCARRWIIHQPGSRCPHKSHGARFRLSHVMDRKDVFLFNVVLCILLLAALMLGNVFWKNTLKAHGNVSVLRYYVVLFLYFDIFFCLRHYYFCHFSSMQMLFCVFTLLHFEDY